MLKSLAICFQLLMKVISRLQIEGYLMDGGAVGCLSTIALIYNPVEALPDPYRTLGRITEGLVLLPLAIYLGFLGGSSLFVAKLQSDVAKNVAKLHEARLSEGSENSEDRDCFEDRLVDAKSVENKL